MRQPSEVEDQDMKWLMAQWEKMDRLFWKTVFEVMRAIAIGVVVGVAISLFLTGLYHFVEMN